MNINPYANMGLYDSHKQWLLEDACIDEATAIENGLFSVSGTALKSLGFSIGQSDAIVFPYFDLDRNPIYGNESYDHAQILRARLTSPVEFEDGKKLRYLSRKGDRFDLYFPAGLKELMTHSDLLVITEGEKKAIAGVNAGIPCIGIAGVWMWHDPDFKKDDTQLKNYEKPINPRFINLVKGKHVIVLADSDFDTNFNVKKAMTTLSQALRYQAEGMSACHVCVCPVGDEGNKQGLDDWLMHSKIESVMNTFKHWQDKQYTKLWTDIEKNNIVYSEHKGQDLHYLVPVVVKSGPQGKVLKQEAVFDRESGTYDVVEKVAEMPLVFLTKIMQILRVNDLIVQENNPDFPSEEGHLLEGIKPSGMPTTFRLTPDMAIQQPKLQSLGVIFPSKKSFEEWIALNYYIASSHQCKIVQATRSKGWMRRMGESWQYLWGSRNISMLPVARQLEAFSVSTSTAKASSGVQHRGDFGRWRDAFMTLLHNPSFAVLAGFACSSLLLSRIRDMEPGIAHIYGDSSHGKSTVQRWLASLIGSTASADADGAYVMSWRTTDNAAENLFYEKNDAVVFLDEMHLIPNNVDVYQTMYQIANGGGKKRSTISSENRVARSWKVQTISSGEISIETAQKTRKPSKEQLPGGLEFRVIQLNVGEIPFLEDLSQVTKTNTWGRYLTITKAYHPSFNKNAPNKIKDVIAAFDRCFQDNFGFAWERMARYLLDDTVVKNYESEFSSYSQSLGNQLPEDASNILKRKSKHVAAAMVGLDLLMKATGMTELKEQSDTIMTQAGYWAENVFWSSGLTRVTGKEGDNIIERFEAHIFSNLNKGFYYIGLPVLNNQNQSYIGVIEATLKGESLDIQTIHLFQHALPDIAKVIGVDERRLANNIKQAGWKGHSLALELNGVRGVENKYYSTELKTIINRKNAAHKEGKKAF